MKFAPHDAAVFVDNVAELESEGIIVNGFELQVTRNDTPARVLKAIDFVKEQFDAKFRGLHPPFPFYADTGFHKWDAVSTEAKLTYTVAHAAIPDGDFTKLFPAVRTVLDIAKSPVFLENVPLRGKREGAGSLLETALLHDQLLVDIPHTIYNWENARRTSTHPAEQVRLSLPAIRAVHVAENDDGNGAIPLNGGGPIFQEMMRQFFPKCDIIYIAEPTGGHEDNGKGHKQTCHEIWRLWGAFSDSF